MSQSLKWIEVFFHPLHYKATGQENPSKQEQALNYTGSGICLTLCQSFMTLCSIKGQSKDIEANCTKSLPLNKQEMQIDKKKDSPWHHNAQLSLTFSVSYTQDPP